MMPMLEVSSQITFWLATICAGVLGCIIAYLLTPIVAEYARRIGAIDDPNRDERRVHAQPIPLWGGIALFFGILLGTAFGWLTLYTNAMLRTSLSQQIDIIWVGVILGSLGIIALGAWDDLRGLSAWVKLLGQIAVAVIAISFGARIGFFTPPFTEHYVYLSPPASWLLSIIWIVGMTNAINLIDGLDGLAAGVSAIAAVTLSILAAQQGLIVVACSLAALAGACIGFLRYNFNPARIFMGDTGAMLLGYLFATLSIAGAVKSALALWLLLITAIVLGYPVGDTLFAIARRVLKGQPIFRADSAHLHHRLLKYGLSQRQAVLMLYGFSILLCLLAFALSRWL